MSHYKTLWTVLLCTFCADLVYAAESEQIPRASELQIEINHMDHMLFDEAFNGCNLDLYKQLTSSDFEFYDDRSGLNKSIDKEIMAFKDRCARPFSVTRKLVSSQAYGLGDYGAVQIGEHEFYEDDQKVEKAKFITVWEKQSDAWFIRRAISYEHRGIGAESGDLGLDNTLQAEIGRMDYKLFDQAFNTCDLESHKQLITSDFEFYDDRSGLNKSIAKEIGAFEDRCASPFAVTRKLVSSHSYALGDYGAVQIGAHEFFEDGMKVEKAKFIIVWERQGASWVLRRAISYEHRPVENRATENGNTAYEFRDDYKRLLDTLMPRLLEGYAAPAAGIGIIRNAAIEFVKVYGEHQKGFAAPDDTIFNVASITKPVVAAAVLKLVEPVSETWMSPCFITIPIQMWLTMTDRA